MSLEALLLAFGIDDDPQVQALAATMKSKAGMPELDKLAERLPSFVKKASTYYEALGRFVSRFSLVETFLQQALWVAAGVEMPVAPAIFSGLKIEGCLQYLKRIADAKGWKEDKKTRLDEITQRLGPINKLRNDLLHYGVSFDAKAEDGWLMSNKDFAHVPNKIREMSVTPQLLADASFDLTKLFVLVMVLAINEVAPKSAASIEAAAQGVLTSAWRYKPPPPAALADKN